MPWILTYSRSLELPSRPSCQWNGLLRLPKAAPKPCHEAGQFHYLHTGSIVQTSIRRAMSTIAPYGVCFFILFFSSFRCLIASSFLRRNEAVGRSRDAKICR